MTILESAILLSASVTAARTLDHPLSLHHLLKLLLHLVQRQALHQLRRLQRHLPLYHQRMRLRVLALGVR